MSQKSKHYAAYMATNEFHVGEIAITVSEKLLTVRARELSGLELEIDIFATINF